MVWLLKSDLPLDTDLDQDLNGDGVSLLMAYALDLDPNENLQAKMPAPVVEGGSLSMSLHAASPELITFTVETSTDLRNWTEDGVSLSAPNAQGEVTASIDHDSPQRFLRLTVEE